MIKKEFTMNHIFKRTIVLLNSLDKIEILLQRAIAFSATHQTTLEILYVHEAPLFAVPDIFLSEEKRSERVLDKVKVKDEIGKRLEALGYTQESVVLVYVDNTVDRLRNHAKDEKESLVICHYHESITPQLMQKSSCAFWINKSFKKSYETMVMPIDLKSESRDCIATAQHIFAESKLELVYDYRYLLDVLVMREDYLNVVPLTTGVDYELSREMAMKNREQFEAYKKEFNVDGFFMEGTGPLHEDLMEYITEQKFDLTVLYHNNEELFFSPTLIVLLLEELESDVFVC